MIKEWFTARELAELELEGFPKTHRRLSTKAQREDWNSRPKIARGGGFEYHINNLPELTRVEIIEKLVGINPACLKMEMIDDEPAPVVNTAEKRADAKVIILKMLEIFRIQGGFGACTAMNSFIFMYKCKKIEGLPRFVYEAYPNLCAGTIYRWKKARSTNDLNGLKGRYGGRKGTGVLDTAENGLVKDFVVGLILAQHHLKAGHIRDLTRAEFGKKLSIYKGTTETYVALPNIRTFERFIVSYKKENAALFLKVTNPDAAKNKTMVAFGSADADVTYINQLWEIDASPVDLLLTDGRYNLYAIIDVWSRRVKIHISKTATTEASLQLVRRAIIDWGVPETLKTDNGSDFISKRFITAIASLGIHQQTCAPFSPEKKPYVERVIGTLQRDLMPLLKGFIGHNVNDRKLIEGRKTFAQRLGTKDAEAFQVALDAKQLQEIVDNWSDDKYANAVHSSINMSPFAKAASSTDTIKRIDSERAIDILLAPLSSGSPLRKITKKGIRINGHTYGGVGMELRMGENIFVRCDPEDMGTIHCFHPESKEFLFTAINPEMTGFDRKELAMTLKKAQKQLEKSEGKQTRKLIRAIKVEDMASIILDQAREDNKNIEAFPQKSEEYTSPELIEASKVDEVEFIDTIGDPVVISKEQMASIQMIKDEANNNCKSDVDIWFDKACALEMKKKERH